MLKRIAGVVCVLLACSWFSAFCSESVDLELGRLTLVEASEDNPYAYWYYVPERALTADVLGLVWHATPGDAMPDDPVFWARFDLNGFLSCDTPKGARINLPEQYGMVLFSIAVTEPLPAFYEEYSGQPLGTPVALSSLLPFETIGADPAFLDPDLKALATVDHLKQQLTNAGIAYDPRLFITGVYSGAEWAHRFTLLHPREIRAAAPVCGNWYTLPYEQLDGLDLPWPLGMHAFEELGRGLFDSKAFSETTYYVTVSANELVWYNEMSPEEQGIAMEPLERYASLFGSIPPERGESFANAWAEAGYPFQLIWSEAGHGWTSPVRIRVFEFFSTFELSTQP